MVLAIYKWDFKAKLFLFADSGMFLTNVTAIIPNNNSKHSLNIYMLFAYLIAFNPFSNSIR